MPLVSGPAFPDFGDNQAGHDGGGGGRGTEVDLFPGVISQRTALDDDVHIRAEPNLENMVSQVTVLLLAQQSITSTLGF